MALDPTVNSQPVPGSSTANLPSPSSPAGWAGDSGPVSGGGPIVSGNGGGNNWNLPTPTAGGGAWNQVTHPAATQAQTGLGAIWNIIAGQYDPQNAYYNQQRNSALGLGSYMQGYYGQQGGIAQQNYQNQLAKLGIQMDTNAIDQNASRANLGSYGLLQGQLGSAVNGLPTIHDLYAQQLQNKLGQIDLDTLQKHQNLDWNTQFGTAGQTLQQGQITQSGEQQKQAATLAEQEQQARANMEGWRLDISKNNEQATLDKLAKMADSFGIDKNILATNLQDAMAKIGLSEHTDLNKIMDMASSADMNIASLGSKIIAEMLPYTHLSPDQIRQITAGLPGLGNWAANGSSGNPSGYPGGDSGFGNSVWGSDNPNATPGPQPTDNPFTRYGA